MSCIGMPTTGSQTFPLPSINDFLTLKQCSADSDHHKGSLIQLPMRNIHTNKQARIMPFIVAFQNWLTVGCVRLRINHFIHRIEFQAQQRSMSGKIKKLNRI